jgi:hypothetical protein
MGSPGGQAHPWKQPPPVWNSRGLVAVDEQHAAHVSARGYRVLPDRKDLLRVDLGRRGETEGRGRRRAGDRITTETRSTRSCTENAGWLDLERLVARRPAAACGRRPTAQRAVRPALTAPSSPDFSVHLRALVTPRWALLRDLRLLRAPTSLSIPAAPPSSTVASVPPPRAHRSASPTRYAARSSSVA